MAKILVVDDEAAISTLLESYLSACGHQVTAARSALGSLGWLDADRFDVVIMDVVMAGPIDGIEVCRTLKSDLKTSGTAVLIISAVPHSDVAAYAAGADAFMAKPFSLEHIRSCVAALAERGPTNPPARSGATVRAAIDSYNGYYIEQLFLKSAQKESLILSSPTRLAPR
jgi:two-component system response regulator ResD